MSNKQKLQILSIIILSLLALLLIIIFVTKIEIIKSNLIVSDGTSQTLFVNRGIHNYLQKQEETKTYMVKNINDNISYKCFLVFNATIDNNYSYYCNLADGTLLTSGIYQTNFDYGEVTMYEYFIYFN